MIRTGKFKKNEQRINVRELLRNLYNIYIQQMKAKDLIFKVKEANDMPEIVVSDQSRIMQVLVNLIQNSHKFTNKGQIIVETSFLRDFNKL